MFVKGVLLLVSIVFNIVKTTFIVTKYRHCIGKLLFHSVLYTQ